MDIVIKFPGGKRVDAQLGSRVIHTDQSPEHGGEGSAPEPFELFLASLASCAGLYVLGFCQARKLSTDGIEIVQRHRFDEATHALTHVELEVKLPAGFPEKYRAPVIRAAAGCKVKKALSAPPELVVIARGPDGAVLARTDAPVAAA